MANVIRVVLQEDVENLGSGGDVVRVRPGFARNYLYPRGLAAPATEHALARIGELKKQGLARAAKQLEEAKALAVRLQASAVKLERAVGAENRMFGSVTSRDIEEAFAAAGVVVDRKVIHLPEPLKTLGLHEVTAKLHAEVTAVLRVEVVKATG
jgi:large subunit ribosomal protein L9